VIAGLITGSVGVVALGVSGVWSFFTLRATRSTEAWKRYQWGVEKITNPDTPEALREAALVVMGEVTKAGSTPKVDREMMVSITTKLAAQPAPARPKRFGR